METMDKYFAGRMVFLMKEFCLKNKKAKIPLINNTTSINIICENPFFNLYITIFTLDCYSKQINYKFHKLVNIPLFFKPGE